MGLFDGKPGCKICGKTEADGCDCWEGFDDYRKAESINDRIATLTAERDKYKAALDLVFSILNGGWGARQAVQLAQEAIIKTLEP